MLSPVRFESQQVVLLDQRLLPHEEIWIRLQEVADVAEAIRTMVVRGAPAIGVTAAFGMAIAARRAAGAKRETFFATLEAAADTLKAARPTAVNLAWAVQRMLEVAEAGLIEGREAIAIADAVEAAAVALAQDDVDANRTMGQHGSLLVPDGARVLVHCNAGALATAGYGTSLGVVRAAQAEGKQLAVIATETRPFLQGARLTAWELQREGIPVTLITDSMAGALMSRGEVDLVLVGADRIAMNGDVANKIGTYPLAVLARRHGIPFYVAAPTSTFDPNTAEGSAIPIEERDPAEVLTFAGQRIAPDGVSARHLAFDVTPASLVTAIICETGILRAPYERNLMAALGLSDDEETGAEPVEPAVANQAAADAAHDDETEELAAAAADDETDADSDEEHELFH